MARFFAQLKVLGWKNVLLSIRNWKGTVGQLLAPVVIILLLLAFEGIGKWVLDRTEPHPVGSQLADRIPPCQVGPGLTLCHTVVYAPGNIVWVNRLMRQLAIVNGLDFDKHFSVMGANELTLEGLSADNATIYSYIVNNPNTTQHAFVFPLPYLLPGMNTSDVPATLPYVLFYNFTAPNNLAAEMLMSVDQATVMLKANTSTKPEYIAVRNKYPLAKSRIAGFDAVSTFGGTWFYLPSMVTFFILLVEIVGEKETRLRLGMRMMGMSNTAYWLTWFWVGLVFSLLSTQILFLSGFASRFAFFTNTNYFAIVLLFSLFGISMVMVSIFLSTLMQTARAAQTIGYAVILVGFVFQTILTSAYGTLADMLFSPDVATWVIVVRWILTLYPPFNLSKAFSDMAVKSSDIYDFSAGKIVPGPGFFWDDLYKTRTITMFNLTVVVPEPMQQILFLIMNAAFYAILAWYFDNVLPGEHGNPRPFYFFLMPSYWGCAQPKKAKGYVPDPRAAVADAPEDYDSDVETEKRRVESGEPLHGAEEEAVRLESLYKVYRRWACKSKSDNVAVDGISLSVKSGEIFCLLGHNGAGKTTTISMLTGLFAPTGGNAFVFGMDIETQMDTIRETLGVCPQHDILFGELTAREHLQIFAQLKGIPNFLIQKEVYDLLARVGLTDVADHRASTFSGGMKRRLSIAISLIGSPKLVFLDEPTTGLDPVNRRAVWHLIQDIKADRCIILTTHSMEEADVLSDRVAIMAYGKIRCLGDSLHLKHKYGSGYRINLITEKTGSAQVIEELQSRWKHIQVSSSDAGSIFLTVPTENLDSVPKILEWIDKLSAVREWGVSHSTLEDVFLNVTKKHNFTYEDIDDDVDDSADFVEDGQNGLDSSSSVNPESVSLMGGKANDVLKPKAKTPPSRPFRALFRKNFTLQARQHFTNVCQVLTPMLVMVILVILRQIIKSQLGDEAEFTLINTMPFPMNAPPISFNFPNGSFFETLAARVAPVDVPHPVPSKTDWVLENYQQHFEEGLARATKGLVLAPLNNNSEPAPPRNPNCITFFYYSDTATPEKAGYLESNGSFEGVMGQMHQRECVIQVFNTTDNRTHSGNGTHHHYETIHIPYAEDQTDEVSIQDKILDILSFYNTIDINSVLNPPVSYQLPDGYIVWNELNTTTMKFNVTMAVNDSPFKNYHRPNNFTRADINPPPGFHFRSPVLIINQGWLQLVSLVSRAFSKWSLMEKGFTDWDRDSFDWVFIYPMPYISSGDIWAILELFGTVLYPIALTLQLPIYIYILVLEKADKLREMMLIHGMQLRHYHFTNYFFCFMLYALVAAFFWISGAAAQMRFFTLTHWSTLLAFYLGWGVALVSVAFFISSLLNSPRASTIVGYTLALLGTMIGLMVSVGIYGPLPVSLKIPMPGWLYIWPQFALTRAMYLLNDACAEKHQCYGPLWSVPISDELAPAIISLYAAAIGYFLVFLYLDAVLPREFGVPKHPLFLFSCCRKNKKPDDHDELPNGDSEIEAGLMPKEEDEDVARERTKVHSLQFDQDAPLVLHNLRKVYPSKPPKVAVKNFCLVVDEGECFALLGENGAGKTTTISMLTGLFPPTAGWASVGGYDIRTEIDSAHLSMGLCAQFDVLWSDLTVLEHALFYARLKGVAPNKEWAHVEHILRDVGLWQSKDKKTDELSGGMKRRLSICISLVGNSRIVFMDEPSSGIDATTRRQLWKIISRAKKGRAIVLTTHAMEEAEVLSNRIGIINKGQLKCLGNQQRLKNKFGDGYCLKITFNHEDEETAASLITKTFASAELSSSFRGTREYVINKTISIAQVFAVMEEQSKAHSIQDWSINQRGLEEVFKLIVGADREKDEKEEEPPH